MASLSVTDTLKAISDDKSLVLFNTIALASGDSTILIRRLNLTRKQYYSRIFDLINAGLVRRINGKYFVTSDASDWDAAARPTLQILWGDPL